MMVDPYPNGRLDATVDRIVLHYENEAVIVGQRGEGKMTKKIWDVPREGCENTIVKLLIQEMIVLRSYIREAEAIEKHRL